MSGTRIVTGKALLSYAHLFEPKAIEEGATAKYSVAVIIPKSDKKTLALIEKGVAAAMEEGKAKLGFKNGKFPVNLKMPLRDGDDEKPDDENYANSVFFNASSTQKPQLVKKSEMGLIKIEDPEELYSGCFGKVSVNFYAFNTSGNKGVAAGLGNVCKLEDGTKLSGGASAEDDFGDDDDMS